MDNYFKTNNFDTKFVGIINHKINMYRYIPLKSKIYIALPKNYSNNNKGLCNIKNDDDKCFKWCHIAFLYLDIIIINGLRQTIINLFYSILTHIFYSKKIIIFSFHVDI